ncbi:MAG: ROK family protein [Capsulimonadaceae bacterium]|nr:ROK family protein [Capsulimonadaceae bacterium]
MTTGRLTLGIDIGGTKIAAALVNDDGTLVVRRQIATNAREGGASVLARTILLAETIVSSVPRGSVAAVGAGAGGRIDSRRGVVLSATDILPGWTGAAIADGLSERLGLPVSVDNDVNALASGECRFGAGKGVATVAFLALGTGVGGALVFDGRIHHGAHFSGGEFGHLLIDLSPDARLDAGGDRGTLEAYVCGSGLVATYHEIAGEDAAPVRGEEIASQALADPDGAAARAIERTGEYLGLGLASLANAIDPDMFVIGGGLALLGNRLLDPARRVLSARALEGPNHCPVKTASLGPDASVIGAASLAMVSE